MPASAQHQQSPPPPGPEDSVEQGQGKGPLLLQFPPVPLGKGAAWRAGWMKNQRFWVKCFSKSQPPPPKKNLQEYLRLELANIAPSARHPLLEEPGQNLGDTKT